LLHVDASAEPVPLPHRMHTKDFRALDVFGLGMARRYSDRMLYLKFISDLRSIRV
jgi:hypothetical protein